MEGASEVSGLTMDDRDREALARKTREDFDAYFRILNRRFGPRWWSLQWKRLTSPYWAARRRLRGRAAGNLVEVDAQLLVRAAETLAASSELEQVNEEVGAGRVKGAATELNKRLPAHLQVDLPTYSGGPMGAWTWLAGCELDEFRQKLVLELGVRYLEFVSLDSVASDQRALAGLIAKRIGIAEWTEDQPDEGRSRGVETWLRLPMPSATYDLDHFRSASVQEAAPLQKPYEEFLAATLQALRECTEKDEWVYAVDGPEAEFTCFRFWPHRASEGMAWPVAPLPHGNDQVFVSQDFGWGTYATSSYDESVDWALSIYGRPLLDAVARQHPPALSRAIRVDGKPV